MSMPTAAPTSNARQCEPRAAPLVRSLHHEALAAYSYSNPRPLTCAHLYTVSLQRSSRAALFYIFTQTRRRLGYVGLHAWAACGRIHPRESHARAGKPEGGHGSLNAARRQRHSRTRAPVASSSRGPGGKREPGWVRTSVAQLERTRVQCLVETDTTGKEGSQAGVRSFSGKVLAQTRLLSI